MDLRSFWTELGPCSRISKSSIVSSQCIPQTDDLLFHDVDQVVDDVSQFLLGDGQQRSSLLKGDESLRLPVSRMLSVEVMKMGPESDLLALAVGRRMCLVQRA